MKHYDPATGWYVETDVFAHLDAIRKPYADGKDAFAKGGDFTDILEAEQAAREREKEDVS